MFSFRSIQPLSVRARRRARAVAGVLRAAGVLLAVALLALALSVHTAKAHFAEAMLAVGARLMLDLEGARYDSGPRSLTVNGLELRVVTASFDDDLDAVLSRFESLCNERTGVRAPSDLEALPNARSAATAPKASTATHRIERGAEGMVACLDTGGPLDLHDLAERLDAFARAGDVSAIGALRLFIARRDAGRTHSLLVWTEGRAGLLDLFPPSGDCAGTDPEGLPRPSGARRILSAREHGAPYSWTVFSVPSGMATVEDSYRASLHAAGWQVQPTGENRDSAVTWLATRGETTLVLRLAPGKSKTTLVSVAQLG